MRGIEKQVPGCFLLGHLGKLALSNRQGLESCHLGDKALGCPSVGLIELEKHALAVNGTGVLNLVKGRN